MANVYSHIQWKKYNKVILLATHHRKNNYVPKSDIYEMKNGTKYNLLKINNVEQNDDMFNLEHSWLVQMPYINNRLPIMIILIGDYNEQLKNSINENIDYKTLVITTIDLLHCGKNYNIQCPENIEAYNNETINMIQRKSKIKDSERTCGLAAINTFIEISKIDIGH